MRSKPFFLYAALIGLALMTAIMVLWHQLPGIAARQVEKQLAGLFNSDRIECEIRQIGIGRFYVSDIYLSSGLRINSIDVDYRLRNLRQFELESIRISGMTLYVSLNHQNKLSIEGLQFPQPPQGEPGDSLAFPFLPEKLILEQSKILFKANDRQLLIPIDALTTINRETKALTGQFILYPIGQKVVAQFRASLDKGMEDIRIHTTGMELSLLNSWMAALGKNIIGENITAAGRSDLVLESKDPVRAWDIKMSRLVLQTPEKIVLENLDTRMVLDTDKISSSGRVDVVLPHAGRIPAVYTASLDRSKGMHINFDLQNRDQDTIAVSLENAKALLVSPKLDLNYKGTLKSGKGNLQLRYTSGAITAEPGKSFDLSMGKGQVHSEFNVQTEDPSFPLNGKFEARLNNTQLKTTDAGINIGLPELKIDGDLKVNQQFKPSARFSIAATKGRVDAEKQQLKLSGIKFKLPMAYPASPLTGKGRYSIDRIVYQNRYTGKTNGVLAQTGLKGLRVSGNGRLNQIPDMRCLYTAVVNLADGPLIDLDINIPSFTLTESHLKAYMMPSAMNAVFNATMRGKGRISIMGGKIKSTMAVAMENGHFEMPDSQFVARGISTDLAFFDLMNLRSKPGQMMTIDEVTVKSVKISDAKLRYSIEGLKSYLVENIRFKWCNGLVSSEAIRFPQEDDTYRLTLYCDRLELTQLLQQIGAFRAEGNGTLNGRIPLVYKDGDIAFENGFLFSTPGSGGWVAIENTNRLTTGIPMDSPQFSQLDLAQEALKDFDYKWAKLKLDTVEDTLFIAMELDGKPAKTLPFQYKKEFGGFIRVDAKSPGSNFQGIKLDVNLKLPFNEVMKFGNKLRALFN